MGILIDSSIFMDGPSDTSTTPLSRNTTPYAGTTETLRNHPSYINNSPFPKRPHVPENRHLSINPSKFVKALEFRKKGTYPSIGVSISKYLETSQNPYRHPETTGSIPNLIRFPETCQIIINNGPVPIQLSYPEYLTFF
jgi:hypothetical protein